MTPGRTADSANGSMTTSRWICQSGSTPMGRSSLKETRLACSLLVRVSHYDATPAVGHGATERTRGASVERVMIPAIQGVCLFLLGLAPPAEVESRFEQVLPRPGMASLFPGRVGRQLAVVLIHGLYLHPFSKENAGRPLLRDWQTPKSRLARELARQADVYAFAYAQNVPVDEVARSGRLLESVRFLRSLDYREIVLVGHSAGGLVARQFVEDHPDEGVTKVIQVCTPNGGSSLAKWPTSCAAQRVFLHSLTKPERQKSLQARQD